MKQREIKFRAWYKNSMVYLNIAEFSDTGGFWGADRGETCVLQFAGQIGKNPGYWHSDFHYPRQMPPVMQYTGLRDKNGKEIYHNDILVVDGMYDPETGQTDREIRVVQYVGASLAFVEYSANEGESYADIVWAHDILGEGVTKDSIIEVIGNVFENPELLEP